MLPKLHERVKQLIPQEKKYELDEIALSMGHKVIRLQPYHCQYNPIELIWAQIKSPKKIRASKSQTLKNWLMMYWIAQQFMTVRDV